jgi:hypothetical protein
MSPTAAGCGGENVQNPSPRVTATRSFPSSAAVASGRARYDSSDHVVKMTNTAVPAVAQILRIVFHAPIGPTPHRLRVSGGGPALAALP